MNKMRPSKTHLHAIQNFEKYRNNVSEQPLYVLHSFASQHKIPGRSTKDRTRLENLVLSWIQSFPKAKIACYQNHPKQVDCRRPHKSIPTRDGVLLRYKILKEEGEKTCPLLKYWICNLQELS